MKVALWEGGIQRVKDVSDAYLRRCHRSTPGHSRGGNNSCGHITPPSSMCGGYAVSERMNVKHVGVSTLDEEAMATCIIHLVDISLWVH